jgi:molybdopterin synthase catalytic subunit
MVELTLEPIRPADVLSRVHSTSAGAEVLFVGTAREFTGGRRTALLHYECYEKMAIVRLQELEAEARQRWNLIGCEIVHRFGTLQPGEASVAIAVSSPHRQEAFQAAQWLIDTLKEVVPIWKQERWSDGSSQWVHPGMPPT